MIQLPLGDDVWSEAPCAVSEPQGLAATAVGREYIEDVVVIEIDYPKVLKHVVLYFKRMKYEPG